MLAEYAHEDFGHRQEDGMEGKVSAPPSNTGRLSQGQVAILLALKLCAKQQDMGEGSILHAQILKSSLVSNIIVGNALLNLYTKCGALAKAKQVFDGLKSKSVVSWTTLISGYCQHGHGYKALSCFDKMQLEGISPNGVTYLCILKACGITGVSKTGEEVHVEVARRGMLLNDNVLGTALIDMYAKCGALSRARQVFDELPDHDIVTWNVLIAAYAQNGFSEEALNCFKQLKNEGLVANGVTYDSLLKACGNLGAADLGTEIHDEVSKKDLLRYDRLLGSALVEMYATLGDFSKANKVFEELPTRDVVCWNMLIKGYCRHGRDREVLSFFDLMKLEGVTPNEVTFVSALGACARIGADQKGKELHDDIARQDTLEIDNVLLTALVDMYVKCGAILKAQEILDEFVTQDVVTWNAFITGCCEQGHCRYGLDCFEAMKKKGLSPNSVTFACLLKACSMLEVVDEGTRIHSEMVRGGWLGSDVVLGNCLIDMYGKCGALAMAQHVFDQLLLPDLVSWTALIAGYSQHQLHQKALCCFESMKSDGFVPDAVTFLCVLSACGSIGDPTKAKEIHEEIAREGLLEKDDVLAAALVHVYAQCSAFSLAHELFDRLSVRTIVLWNVLLAGYCGRGDFEAALGCFEQMKHEGVSPDAFSFVYVMKLCGSAGASAKGEEIHGEMVRVGLLRKAGILGGALIDMYAKSGALCKAKAVFEELSERDVVSWTTLIAGYAQIGRHDCVFDLFGKMIGEGLQPSIVTLLVVLGACGCSGLEYEGQTLFENLRMHGIVPTFEHHRCMVALFGRSGHLGKALDVIKRMPSSDHLPLWFALLGACHKLGDAKVARLAFEHAVKLDLNEGNHIRSLLVKPRV